MKKLLKKIVAVGLSAAMMLSTAVTAFAEEVTPTLKLDKSELSLQLPNASGTITATTTGSEKLTAESENDEIATVEVSGSSISIVGKAAGVIDVDIAYGDLEETVVVTVLAEAKTYTAAKFYSDSEKKTAITKIEDGLFVNGTKIVPADVEGATEKVDYKNVTIYTDATADSIDPDETDAKVVSKAGKIVVAVTKSDVTDVAKVISDGKVQKDADAAKTLKASYKKDGSIKLTAGSVAGTVNLWVIDLGANKTALDSAYIPVTVKDASAVVQIGKTETVDDEEVFTIAKSAVAVPTKAVTLNVNGLNKDKKTAAADAKFAVKMDDKSAALIDSAEVSEAGVLTITAKALTAAKAAKAKVSVYDVHSGKKADVAVTIVDTVKSVATTADKDDLTIEKNSATLTLAVTTNGGSAYTTDKAKVYVVAKGKTPYLDSKGKLSVKNVSRKDLSVKLDNKTGKITLTAKDNYSTCDVYVAYTDAASKTTQLVKIAAVTDGKLAPVATSNAVAAAALEAEED